MISSFIVSYLLSPKLLIIFLAYFFLQLIYSFGLKHVVILDVMLLASGFVIRAVAGGVAIGAHVSNWLLLCTFLLALFLALCKRRQELVVLEKNAADHRPVLAEYSAPFIDSLISVITGATVVSYALYTVSHEVIRKLGTDKLIFTLPFVLYGIFRYLYLMHQKDLGDNPTKVLFTDFSLQLGILLWLIICSILIYFRM
jgi:4-hydroxybenzoate polyprenyltransferase